jgi:RNA polymerase subunit RPABC4/transcription elongation factor Spt4
MNDDGENAKFCHNCGGRLNAASVCERCAEREAEYYRKKNEKTNRTLGWRNPTHLQKELKRRGEVSRTSWFKYQVQYYKTHVHTFYACDACKYIMYHQMRWCPLCGGQLRHDKATTVELGERYGAYREGY